jgi:hypothetical protein
MKVFLILPKPQYGKNFRRTFVAPPLPNAPTSGPVPTILSPDEISSTLSLSRRLGFRPPPPLPCRAAPSLTSKWDPRATPWRPHHLKAELSIFVADSALLRRRSAPSLSCSSRAAAAFPSLYPCPPPLPSHSMPLQIIVLSRRPSSSSTASPQRRRGSGGGKEG